MAGQPGEKSLCQSDQYLSFSSSEEQDWGIIGEKRDWNISWEIIRQQQRREV